jgi:hypothetical protein
MEVVTGPYSHGFSAATSFSSSLPAGYLCRMCKFTIETTFGINRTWPMRPFPNLPETGFAGEEIIGPAATAKVLTGPHFAPSHLEKFN